MAKIKLTEKDLIETIRQNMISTLKEAMEKIVEEQIEEATQKLRKQATEYIASMGMRIAKWVDIQRGENSVVITLQIKEEK